MGFSRHKEEIERPVHGGLVPGELAKLGIAPENVLDFSASINPLGASPAVREILARLDLASYPDPDCTCLREALAGNIGTSPENIVVGNGSTELIHLIARAYLCKGDTAAILSPTFSEYESACRLARACLVFIRAGEANGFAWDMEKVCREIRRLQPRLVFLCNPNNPTGVYLDRETVSALSEAAGRGLFAIDEAYISFAPGAPEVVSLPAENVVVLRSMTKDHALTALRLGYAICREELARRIAMQQPAWSVTGAAQAAVLAALSAPTHLDRARRCVAEGKSFLQRELAALGLKIIPSAANFLLVRVGNAAALRAALLAKGICVRDCTSFGLPDHIRIAVRTVPECQRLIDALRGVIFESRYIIKANNELIVIASPDTPLPLVGTWQSPDSNRLLRLPI